MLERSEDELEQAVRPRSTAGRRAARSRTGFRGSPNVPDQRRLVVERRVRLPEIVGEKRRHRQLDDLLELSLQVADRLRKLPRNPSIRLQKRSDPGRRFLPQVADILQGDRDHAISEEVSRLCHPDPPGDGAVLRREEELSHNEPVQPIHFELHAANLLDVPLRIPRDDAERELLHAGRQVMESPEEAVDGEPRRLDEILDRDEFRALVHDRESGQAADRLVDLLQLTRGQLLSTAKADRVASDDVVPGNHSRERLRPAPFVRVNRRLRGDRIFLKGTDPHAEASVVLDREAQEGAGADPVRRGPVFRERDPEARIAELLDLAGFELHGSAYIRARINTYSVGRHGPP